jgi:hypothetical protein
VMPSKPAIRVSIWKTSCPSSVITSVMRLSSQPGEQREIGQRE